LLVGIAATTVTAIRWISDYPAATLATDVVVLVQTNTPNGFAKVAMSDLMDYVGLNATNLATQAQLTSSTNVILSTSTNSAKSYADSTFALSAQTNALLAGATNSAKSYADATFHPKSLDVITNNHAATFTMYAPLLSLSSSSTNGPADNELVGAHWVRGLQINGFLGYNSTNLAPGYVYGATPYLYVFRYNSGV